MPTTTTQARDRMFGMVLSSVGDLAPEEKPLILFENSPGSSPTDKTKTWIRVSLRTTDERQATIASSDGRRRWRAQGVLTVQCFTPRGPSDSDPYTLPTKIRDFFRSNSGEPVDLYDPRIREIGQDGPYFHVQFLVDFEYDYFA